MTPPIPSPKAEQLKRRPAKENDEFIQEIENPESIYECMRAICRSKGLELPNLCDSKTDLESIFSMLGDAATAEIARKQNTQGLTQNEYAACIGGRIADDARKKLESETRNNVSTSENYLEKPETS
jgi:hypothetical protein